MVLDTETKTVSSNDPKDVTKFEVISDQESTEVIIINKHVEKSVVRKLDLFVVSWLAIFYFFCQLDRSNLGFANTAGFSEDINLKNNEFGDANTYLYITYLTLEPVNTLLLKKITPKYLMITCAFAWGMTTLCQGFIQNAGGLYACRLIMGFFESGIVPITYLLSNTLYTKSEKSKRHAVVFTFAAFASAFGGLLAYGLLRVTGPKHLREGWRVLFFAEGLMTIGVLPLAWFTFPKSFKQAWFFNDEEKKTFSQRLEYYPELKETDEFQWSVILNMFKDFRFYAHAIFQFCCALSFYSSSTFLPKIVSSMGYTGIDSNLMAVPIYLYGALYYIAMGALSDYFKIRSLFMGLSTLAMVIGYAILLGAQKNGIRYFGCFFMIMGIYPTTGLNMLWVGDNLLTHYQKASYIGFGMAIGNTSGLVYGQVFRAQDAPRYDYGIKVGLIMTCIAIADMSIIVLYYNYLNRKKVKAIEEAERAGVPLKRQPELGDKDPYYMYTF